MITLVNFDRELIDEIKRDEGFEPMPYNDHLGYPTIGYGTKLPIDETEAELLLEKRLNDSYIELRKRVEWFDELPGEAKTILLNMAYNLGVSKLMKFRRMWAALERRDYITASREMRNSLWYRQVTNRAERLARKMEAVSSENF